MTTNGITADTKAIAEGLYGIICEKGEEALVAFGMIPKWVMDMTEPMVREKIISEAARKRGCTAAELSQYLDEPMVRSMTAQIMKEVATEIYGAAKRAGKMIV